MTEICPVCGRASTLCENHKCQYCNHDVIALPEDRSYGHQDYEILIDQYARPTGLFNEELYKKRVKIEQDWIKNPVGKPYWSTPYFERVTEEARAKVRAEIAAESPHCPVCGSANIHKISAANKVGAAAVFGIFAIGHVSKTYKCDNCGAKF
jgi:hypothetical protein